MSYEYSVTIGIPVYQAREYVRNSLLSALGQSYPDIEFLIVDDCGNDGSMEIIEELQRTHARGEHIRILKNPRNLQVGYTRNRVIDEACGEYLYFLDSDDLIEPDTIQLLVKAINDHQAEVAYASYEVVDRVNDSPNREFRKPSCQFFRQGQLALYAFKHASIFHVSVCNCLYRLDFLRREKLRFLDTAFWEDMAFTYELVQRVSRAVLLSDITYHYILRPGSLSHYQDREQLDKSEIMNNVSTIDYLKGQCRLSAGKSYLPYLCYNLEMSSFYIVCHIVKHASRISPAFTWKEMHRILRHPLGLAELLFFRSKLLHNLVLWTLGRLPVPLFIPSLWIMGKLKRTI